MPDDEPRRRGPYAKTRKRREAIATATLALVMEKGHTNVTVADVATRADLPEATVLYHFPTRDHLFIAAIEVADNNDVATGLRIGDPHRIDRALHDIAATEDGHRNRVRLFTVEAANASDPDHPANAWFQARSARVRSEFADMLTAAKADGEAHPDVDPERFARQMEALWDGLQVQWLASPDFDLAEEVAAAFRTLARVDAAAARRAIESLAADL